MLCKGTTWLHTAHVHEIGAADPTFTVQDASLRAQIGRLGYGGTPIVGANSGGFKRSSDLSALNRAEDSNHMWSSFALNLTKRQCSPLKFNTF